MGWVAGGVWACGSFEGVPGEDLRVVRWRLMRMSGLLVELCHGCDEDDKNVTCVISLKDWL